MQDNFILVERYFVKSATAIPLFAPITLDYMQHYSEYVYYNLIDSHIIKRTLSHGEGGGD